MNIGRRELLLIAIPALLTIPFATFGGILGGHGLLWVIDTLTRAMNKLLALIGYPAGFATVFVVSAITAALVFLPGAMIAVRTAPKFGRNDSDPAMPKGIGMAFMFVGLVGLLAFFLAFCSLTARIEPVHVFLAQVFDAIGLSGDFLYSYRSGTYVGWWLTYVGYLFAAGIPWFFGSLFASITVDVRKKKEAST